MQEVETGRFTVGVFQDTVWAERGISALKAAGFPAESLSVLGKDSPELAALTEKALGTPGQRFELPGLGPVLMRGPLFEVLDGPEFRKIGLAGSMRRVGFQQHDGRIFEVLTGRGGVLVAIRSEPAAAEALALLHSYGGGNAAIGAWSGRV
jgi:hypothetical protein